MSATGPRWITACLDLPTEHWRRGTEFWTSVTGQGMLADDGGSATLVPPHGDPYLRMRRVASRAGGVQLELHTDDEDALTDRALACGAAHGDDGLASPGGLVFRVLAMPDGTERPPPVPWWGGTSLVDQVCVDIPQSRFDSEADFWAALTGWERRHWPAGRPEFDHLLRPAGQPLRLLLQQLETDDGTVTAHLDLASSDRVAEVVRHRTLDASYVRETPQWTTLRDPAGLEYCVTVRDPVTGTTPDP